MGKIIEFPDYNSGNGLWHGDQWTKNIIAEELGHSWDIRGDLFGGWNGGHISQAMIPYIGASTRDCAGLIYLCWNYQPGQEAPVNNHHASLNPVEDWGGAFAQFVEPLPAQNLGPLREQYIKIQIALLVTEIK